LKLIDKASRSIRPVNVDVRWLRDSESNHRASFVVAQITPPVSLPVMRIEFELILLATCLAHARIPPQLASV